jgi:hypothetical protein
MQPSTGRQLAVDTEAAEAVSAAGASGEHALCAHQLDLPLPFSPTRRVTGRTGMIVHLESSERPEETMLFMTL